MVETPCLLPAGAGYMLTKEKSSAGVGIGSAKKVSARIHRC